MGIKWPGQSYFLMLNLILQKWYGFISNFQNSYIYLGKHYMSEITEKPGNVSREGEVEVGDEGNFAEYILENSRKLEIGWNFWYLKI